MSDICERFPAEWEAQDGVLVAWPHSATDWAADLAAVESTYVALIAAITRFERCLVCVADTALMHHATALLVHAGVDPAKLTWIEIEYDDTWLRDTGPISLIGGQAGFRILDFNFNGWGGKFRAQRDDALVSGLVQRGLFQNAVLTQLDFVLEGGAIETDGAGTLLSTWTCLHRRHPQRTRTQIEQQLHAALPIQRILWLEHGELQGDDTDAHIDTLARFTPAAGIIFQACNDSSDLHFAELDAMRKELEVLRDSQGVPYRLHALPWPPAIIEQGRRLAVSYANYLLVNGGVLVPAYELDTDTAAAEVIARAYPDRVMVPVPCRPLIRQNGSLHCVSMQLPSGLLAI